MVDITGKLGSKGLMNVQFMYPLGNEAWNNFKKVLINFQLIFSLKEYNFSVRRLLGQ